MIEEYDIIFVTQDDKCFEYDVIKAAQKYFGCTKNHTMCLEGMIHVVGPENEHIAYCQKCGYAISIDGKHSFSIDMAARKILNTNPVQYTYDIDNRVDRFFKIKEKIQNTEPQTFKQWYNGYLQSDIWKRKRQFVLQRASNLCESCMTETATVIHHLTYDRVGREPLFDLVALCDNCHKQIHNI